MGKIVDLSIPVEDWMPFYPGDPVPHVKKALTLTKDGCRVRKLSIGTHTGTHVDAPAHFIREGSTIEHIPMDRFMGQGVVIDLMGLESRHQITVEDLTNSKKTFEGAEVALLHTGWMEKYGNAEFYEHPYLTREAAEYLVAQGIKAVGVDMLNVDRTLTDGELYKPGGMAAHEVLLGNEVIIIENMTNLELIDFEAPHISYVPLKITDGDGSPVRAFAMELTA